MNSKKSKFLEWINYRVRVVIQDSRMLVGTLLAFDKHMNLVLADTEEYTRIKSKREGELDKERKRALGLVLLRGENIISFSAESPPTQNDDLFNEKIKNLTEGKSQPISRGMQINEINNPLIGQGKSIGIGNNILQPQNNINMMGMKYNMSNMPMMSNMINQQMIPNMQGIIRPNIPMMNPQFPNQQPPQNQ